ncbi:hypothetical protein QFC21_000669 [Naganishia friedmannii]|uniref:Uncharacterized protein n=1 Tax=Naganishia friedmannii TaxID=89922 RepID=A0ACC2WDD5_9TREE|nr:hypothetical protein QFC21_000669 [Naganishia friedmannii]
MADDGTSLNPTITITTVKAPGDESGSSSFIKSEPTSPSLLYLIDTGNEISIPLERSPSGSVVDTTEVKVKQEKIKREEGSLSAQMGETSISGSRATSAEGAEAIIQRESSAIDLAQIPSKPSHESPVMAPSASKRRHKYKLRPRGYDGLVKKGGVSGGSH